MGREGPVYVFSLNSITNFLEQELTDHITRTTQENITAPEYPNEVYGFAADRDKSQEYLSITKALQRKIVCNGVWCITYRKLSPSQVCRYVEQPQRWHGWNVQIAEELSVSDDCAEPKSLNYLVLCETFGK